MKSEVITLADQEARNRIKNDIKTNLIVEAGAGSGKTTEMSNRIVALLESGYRTIGEIAAITFTNKAANELQHRVHARLESVYRETGNEIIRDSLENYHLCFIGTIHAFCGKLLRERPIEAGVDPGFDEIDEAEDLAIRDKIWEDYVFSADDEGKELLDILNVLNIKVAALKNYLRIVCDNQDVEFNLGYEDKIDMECINVQINKVFDALDEFMQMAKHDLPEGITLSSDGLDGMQKSILMFLRKTKNRDDLSLEEKVRLLNRYTTASSAKVTQKCWSDDKELKKRAKEIGIEMEELREAAILPLFNTIKTYAYNKVFIPFVEKTKAYYTQYKKQTGKMNFQDLLILTNRMLKESVDARMHFQDKYKTLLVDEFQDTDPIQAQILMFLTGEELEEKRWDSLTPYPGSLFVVGDPKQSIYAFRRADIEIYEKFKQLVIQKGGALVELTTNFRASKDLGLWYNETFSHIFSQVVSTEQSFRMQATFSDLQAINASLENTLSGVYLKKVAAKQKAEVQYLEFLAVKEMIEMVVGKKEITTSTITNENGNIKLQYNTRNIQYKDIMILTMKKAQLTQLSNDLSNSGIPIKAVGADVIQKTPTFSILSNVIKMLAYPEENGYLYRVMVCEPFHFKDDELARFRQLGGWINIYSNIEKLMQENEENPDDLSLLEAISGCFKKLKRLAKLSKVLPSTALIERIAEELGLHEKLIEGTQQITEIGSYSSLLEQLRLKPLQSLWGLDVFMTELSNLIATGLEEEIDIQGGDYDAVRIMNVHKSKGLEAPIIILAGSYSGNFQSPSLYIERSASVSEEALFKGHISLNSDPDKQFNKDRISSNYWGDVEEISSKKHSMEFDRLIYVAATRARNALIVFSSENTSDPWDKLGIRIENSAEEIGEIADSMVPEVVHEIEDKEREVKANSKTEEVTISGIEKNRNIVFNENELTYKVIVPSKADESVCQMVDALDGIEICDFDNIFIELKLSETTDEELSSTVFGTNIHRLFEAVINGNVSMDDLLTQMSANYKDATQMMEVFKVTKERFSASTLYSRIQNAEEVHCEVPFAYKKQEEDTEITYYINGTIDLVFKENGAWKIVDYKTCNRNHDKNTLYNKYRGQLELYKEAWRTCTGFDNVTAELFFVEK